MFGELTVRGVDFRPARFLAPMAEITHAPFRRLVAELGGCGGFFTEMLSARQLLAENLKTSPWVQRSRGERRLIFQLMLRHADRLDAVIGRVAELRPDGIDINLACHAPTVRRLDAGSRLFDDLTALSPILRQARRAWTGWLSVKIRLGHERADWQTRFAERLRLFEDSGVDAVILHPRFFEDKFKRRARHELLPWAARLTPLPVIASGDITGPETIRENRDAFSAVRGILIGRMAIARPWLFAAWDRPICVDYAEVWNRLSCYLAECFEPAVAAQRLKRFTKYYARNFRFGHVLYGSIQHRSSLDDIRERAAAFFAASPETVRTPSLMGL